MPPTIASQLVSIDRFALVIGAMKSGTTTLDGYLRQHPQIAPNEYSKEPGFFSFEGEYARGLDHYHSQWSYRPSLHRFALESSTTYSQYPTYPQVPERIRAVNAHFRLIYIVRHPVDRIESQLAHGVAYGWISVDRRSGRILAGRRRLQFRRAIEYSSYAMQLDRYRATLPTTPILLLDFDDLKSDPASVMTDVTRFLDLKDHQFTAIGTKNPRKDRYGSDLVALSAEQRTGFETVLRTDVRRLEEEYGFDTSNWSGFQR